MCFVVAGVVVVVHSCLLQDSEYVISTCVVVGVAGVVVCLYLPVLLLWLVLLLLYTAVCCKIQNLERILDREKLKVPI